MNQTLLNCRLCLSHEDCVNIFAEVWEEKKIHELIKKYLSVDIKLDDFIKLVCIRCIQTVENFNIFYADVASKQQVIIGDGSCIYFHTISDDIVLTNGTTLISTEDPKNAVFQDYPIENENIRVQIDFTDLPPTYDETQIKDAVELEKTIAPFERNIIKEELMVEDEEMIEMEKSDNEDEIKFNGDDTLDDDQENDMNYENDEDIEGDEEEVGEYADDEEQEDCFDSTLQVGDINAPKNLIQGTKLLVKGKELSKLMSKFYRLECDQCSLDDDQMKLKFNDLASFGSHYNIAHSMKGYVICCGQKFVKLRAMALHMARHLQPDAFRCPECDKLMTCPKILQYHIKNHMPEEQRPLACPHCPRRFSYSSALATHAITHQPEKERTSHQCNECDKSFSTPGRLSTHISTCHTRQENPFVCHICGKKFTSKGNLSYHLTTHQPPVHQVQCQVCNKWLKNKLCLRKHMIQHQMERHTCHLCNYTSLNKQVLSNHLKVKHSDSKPFSCEVCGKTFKLKNTLINHIAQHTGVRKFSCEFCKRNFASSGNYYSHRKRMHPIELAQLKLKKQEKDNTFREQFLQTKS